MHIYRRYTYRRYTYRRYGKVKPLQKTKKSLGVGKKDEKDEKLGKWTKRMKNWEKGRKGGKKKGDQSGFLEAPFVRMLRMRSASLKNRVRFYLKQKKLLWYRSKAKIVSIGSYETFLSTSQGYTFLAECF